MLPQIYPGSALTNEAFDAWRPVLAVDRGRGITLEHEADAQAFTDANGDGVTDFWLVSFRPGAAAHLEAVSVVP